jgi:hypothetical protein
LALSVLVTAAYAETSAEDANPYAVISDRNVFHLNPEPRPEDSAPPPKPPDLPKILLSGFQKIGDRLKVYLAIPAKDPKDTAYLALQAGEKENDVEIVKIREEKGEVDILNTGTPMTLTLASNGFAATGGAAAGGTGTAPARGGPSSGGPPGIGHRMMPGMSRPNIPAAAASAPAQAYSGGSAIVVGGNGDNGGSSSAYGGGSSAYGNSGGVSVSGGNSYGGSSYGGGVGATAAGNNTSAQVANALFGNNSGHVPTPEDIVPAPPEVQAAGLLLNEKAGGPPSPYQPGEEGGGPPRVP